MQLIRHSWIGLLCLALNLPAQTNESTDTLSRSLALEECIRLAVEHNLEIKVQRHDPSIARFSLKESYGAYDPRFSTTARRDFRRTEGGSFVVGTTNRASSDETETDVLSGGFSGLLPWGTTYQLSSSITEQSGNIGFIPFEDYRASAGFSATQPLLRDFWIDASRLDIKVRKHELRISEYAFQLLVMDVVNRTRRAYFDLIATRDNVKAAEKALERAERLLMEERQRVKVGTKAPLDEKQAEAEAALALADLIQARQGAALAENNLKNLITDDYERWHAVGIMPSEKLVAVPESYNRGESWYKGLTLRPDFNSQRVELERRGVIVKFRQNQLFPRLDLQGGYARLGIDDSSVSPLGVLTNGSLSGALDDINAGRSYNWFGGITLSFPLSNRRERYQFRSAKEDEARARDEFNKLRQDILVGIDDAINVAQSSFQRVEATRLARGAAEAAYDAEQKKLENGKSTSFNVLNLQRDLTLRRFQEINALADYNKALSNLYFSEGTILEKSKVTVEVK